MAAKKLAAVMNSRGGPPLTSALFSASLFYSYSNLEFQADPD
jgi:hypothetical protein